MWNVIELTLVTATPDKHQHPLFSLLKLFTVSAGVNMAGMSTTKLYTVYQIHCMLTSLYHDLGIILPCSPFPPAAIIMKLMYVVLKERIMFPAEIYEHFLVVSHICRMSGFWQEVMESSAHRRLFVTRILKQFDCDTFIPNIDLDKFSLLPE